MVEAPREEEQRPAIVLAVYSWDLILAILAVFGVLAAFAGGLATKAGQREIPLAIQIMAALSSAAYAAVLIIVASLLTRRRRWVRRMQVATMVAAILLGAASVLANWIAGSDVPVAALLVTLFFVLVDVLVIVLMTERRVVEWYHEPGPAPRYASGALAFWALTGGALVVMVLVLR